MENTEKMDVIAMPSSDLQKMSKSQQLDDMDDKLSNPDSSLAIKENGVASFAAVEVDAEEDCILLNDSDEHATNEVLNKSNSESNHKRDMGCDLDALLHTISSITDSDGKKQPEKPQADKQNRNDDDNSKENSITTEAKSKNSEDSFKQFESTDNDDSTRTRENGNVDDENAEVNEVEDITFEERSETPVQDEDIKLDCSQVDEIDKAGNDVDDETKAVEGLNDDVQANTKSVKQTANREALFLEALETISSSSDEFSQPQKIIETKRNEVNPNSGENLKDIHANGLDSISSDDCFENSQKEKEVEEIKTDIQVIDLDSSDETIKELPQEIPDENGEKEDKQEKESLQSGDKEQAPAVEAAATDSIENMDIDEQNSIDKNGTEDAKNSSIEQKLIEIANSCEAVMEDEAEQSEHKKNTLDAEEIDHLKSDANVQVEPKDKELIETDTIEDEAEQNEETVKSTNEDIAIIKPDALTSDNQNHSEADSKDPESEDDDVIIFEPIEEESGKKADKVSDSHEEPEISIADKKDNEVVLVSEDEDEDLNTKQIDTSKPNETGKEQLKDSLAVSTETTVDSQNEAVAAEGSKVVDDNSDNACDQFAKPKVTDEPETNANDDTNSNSSSNLLRPSRKSSVQASNISVHVDLIADEVEEEQEPDVQPPKRPRLSNDEDCASLSKANKISAAASTETVNIDTNSRDSTGSKRTHDMLASSPSEEKSETTVKKVKTDDTDSNSSSDGQLQIDLEAGDNTKDPKAVTTQPITVDDDNTQEETKKETYDLKPAPEFISDVPPLRLQFIKNFSKSFDKMTRDDLEELVLQKVVEVMLIKSDFADTRRQLDKYEVALSTYRRKIADLSKQFSDLDTVHKRVLKDLEAKNSHFTAPVRITRAVGLQVGLSIRKPPEGVQTPSCSNTSSPQVTPSAAAAPRSSPNSKAPQSAARSPQRGCLPTAALANSARPGPQSGAHFVLRNFAPTNSSPSPTPPVRRGCMQKVTPQRPVNTTPASRNSPPSLQRLTPTSTSSNVNASTQSRHISKHTSSNSPSAAVAAALAAANVRGRMASESKQQTSQGPQRPGLPKVTTKVRSMPVGGTVSVPMSNAAASSSAAVFGKPNLAPAKPKEKAVIDLTDEDDAAAAAAAAVAAAAATANAKTDAVARLRQQNNNLTVKRTVQMNNNNNSTNVRPVAGSVVRVSPMSLPRSNAVARQIVGNSNSPAQRAPGSAMSTNVTIQIRSDNTPNSSVRQRNVHPAPLPSSPAQTFNPTWKLPPSRPVIRISLHESGIVISWTLEDTGDRFSSCVTYQIYAYQETLHEPSTDSWRHVGDVKAMLLPMAVTLNQFQENQRYYFAVRGVDEHQRYGAFSAAKTWS